MVRVTLKGATAAGLLPRRRTSAAPPFSTIAPSGLSEVALPAGLVVQVPSESALKAQ